MNDLRSTSRAQRELRPLRRGIGRAWFDENLSKDFLNTNPDASLVDRAGFLARIAQPAGVTGLRPEDVNIRLFGDVAIIHARTVYTKPDGSAGSRPLYRHLGAPRRPLGLRRGTGRARLDVVGLSRGRGAVL